MSGSATAKVKQVPVDKEATLELKVQGGKEGDPVTFTVFKVDGDEQVDTVDGTIKKGKAVAKWAAKGPEPDGEDRSLRVYYTCEVNGVKTVSPELEVYLAKVEVTSQQEDGSALADAPFVLKVGKKEIKGNTGSSGTYTVDNVPPGELEITWRAPLRFVEWVEDTAGKKKAKLKKSFKAQLLWPPEGDHKQWVNLKKDPKKPEQGNRLQVRVGVHPDDGPSRAGDVFYAKIEYPAPDDLSPRTQPKRELVKGKVHPWSDPDPGIAVELKKDGAEATFELELGLAGGDQVTLKVGGTDTCEDAEVTITNWRRVFYQLTRNKASVIHDLSRADGDLADVFVVYEQSKELTFERKDTPKDLPGAWVDAAEFGGTAGDLKLVIGSHNATWFRKQFVDDKKPLGNHVMICDKQYDAWESAKSKAPLRQLVSFDLKKATDWSPALDGEVFQTNLADGKHPLVSGSWTSTAPKGKPGAGKKGKLAAADVAVDRTQQTRRVLVTLPGGGSGPGDLVGDGTDDAHFPVRVTLTLTYALGPYLGESDGPHQLIVLTPGSDCFNDTITHELGHTLRQAPSKTNAPPKGLVLDDHPHRYNYHGHSGPHCAHGLNAAATHKRDGKGGVVALAGDATDEDDYGDLCKADGSSVFGDCVMYGSGPSNDPSSAADGFCADCKPYVKAQAMTTMRS